MRLGLAMYIGMAQRPVDAQDVTLRILFGKLRGASFLNLSGQEGETRKAKADSNGCKAGYQGTYRAEIRISPLIRSPGAS